MNLLLSAQILDADDAKKKSRLQWKWLHLMLRVCECEMPRLCSVVIDPVRLLEYPSMGWVHTEVPIANVPLL